MRPLTLKLTGLRSYRREQSIDFTDAGLMAIVGDTGAGKSSLLDGIFFALYGGCTWDRRAVTPLIADGEATMQVELVFLAEGRRWKVFRSASRTGTATRAELVCLDDPADRYDNSEPVTAKIRQLVGLDDDAFLRTVILPQGRFQALLQATKGDRTAILKGIFRLEQLEAVRVAADQAARRLRPRVNQLREERASLLLDPAASLIDAESRQRDARGLQATLKELAGRITTLEEEKNELHQRGGDLRQQAERVREDQRPGVPDRIAALAEHAQMLEGQLIELDVALSARRTRTDELESALREADTDGVGVSDLAAASTTLQPLIEMLPGLTDEAEACTRERLDLATLTTTIAGDEAAGAERRRAIDRARAAAETAATVWRQSGESLDHARRALGAARSSAQEALIATGQARDAESLLEPAGENAARADVEMIDAVADQERAEAHLDAILRAYAAVHAAEASHPGAPCPVCRRALPDDFVAPEAPGDSHARTALAASKARVKTARAALGTAKEKLAQLDERARQAGSRRTAAVTNASTHLDALRALIPSAGLDHDDETLLAALARAAATAEVDARQAAGNLAALERQASQADGALESARQELRRRTIELDRREQALAARTQSCQRGASELPAAYRPALPLEPSDLAAVAKRVAVRQTELADVVRELDSLRSQLRELDGKRTALARRRRDEVDEPAGELDRQLAALSHRLADLVDRLGQGENPPRPGGDLAQQVDWARRLTAAVAEALAASGVRIGGLETRSVQLDHQVRTALEGQGFASREEVGEAQIAAAATLARAMEDAATARAHLPRATALEATIGTAGGLLEALDELTKLLTDGRFIGRVVAHKQKTLLAVASEILGNVTGGRYGFSEDFEIIDRLTGLPRGVKTLSGGETFLASLALALGLVELAGRGGGRLDALFLDEGFGSLDANSLAEALDALGRQAEGGRLVVVISHLRAVAEAMEHLVAVTRGPDGSRIRPLSGTDRDQMVEEEIEASLLS